MSSFRKDFLLPENFIYLNSGSMALTPKSVLAAAQAYKTEQELNPAYALFTAWHRLWPVQKKLAAYFKADPKHIFLRPNVTYVMNDFIMALKLPAGSEILISDLEYGAVVNICKYKAETDNLTIQTMKIPADLESVKNLNEDQIVEIFKKNLTAKTSLVMMSHVMTGSGLKLPIEKMAEVCRAKGIIFAVDGAHGAGSCDLDFSKTKVDFYGTNLHKWLMGPKGTGFGWVAPEIRDRLEPKFAGWTSYDLPKHFAVFGDGDKWTCRWMICSTHDYSPFLAVSETIDYWNQNGTDKIMKAQKEICSYTEQAVMEQKGWKSLSQFKESLKGPLIAFQLPTEIAQKGFDYLFHLHADKKVQVSMTMIQGNWCLRLAPHIYNTHEEIQEAIKRF